MNASLVPISTLFIALILSYIVVVERVKTRIWHGESKEDILLQPDPLAHPTAWVTTVEKTSRRLSEKEDMDEAILQRKVRAHGNFTEYIPLGLLFLIVLELNESPLWLVGLLGVTLTLGRVIYTYGVITRYGPSRGRAIGFFATWFVYAIGSLACIYYSLLARLYPI